MVSFEQFQMEDGSPIYLQIVSFVQRGIVAGTITDGDEMPSRRVLSALIGVNPNTIQKAYAELERIGMIYSSPGRGSFVSGESSILRRESFRLAQESLAAAMHEAKLSGFSADAARNLINEIWREES